MDTLYLYIYSQSYIYIYIHFFVHGYSFFPTLFLFYIQNIYCAERSQEVTEKIEMKKHLEREMDGGMNGGGNGNNNSSMRGDELHSSTEMVVHSATLAMQAAAAAGEREQEIMKKEIIILKKNMKEMEVKVKETMDLQVVTESEKNELKLVGCF